MSRSFFKLEKGIRTFGLPTDPSSPQVGDTYFNTTALKWRFYDGAVWHDLGAGAGWSAGPLDPDAESRYLFYTRSDFAIELTDLVDFTGGATTATNDIANLDRLIFTTGQKMTSYNLTGDGLRDEALQIYQASAKVLYSLTSFDTAPLVEFSRDGGATWVTGTTTRLSSKGDIQHSEATFTGSTVFDGTTGIPSSSRLGTKVAAYFTPAFDCAVTGFQVAVRTAATTGVVTGKIQAVTAGVPAAVLATSTNTASAVTDITPVYSNRSFAFAPITLIAGTQYALVLDGAGLDADLEIRTVTGIGAPASGAASYSGSWTAFVGDKADFKVFGGGVDLRLRVTASQNSEMLGFGVDYVTDSPLLLTGDSSFEERVLTAGEAATGLIVLGVARYTPGTHQLTVQRNTGVTYVAPDFLELSPNQVQFPPGFFPVGAVLRFIVGFGLVDGTSSALSKFAGIYSAIVGSLAQVANGVATHSSLTAAISAAPIGGRILVLAGTYVENISLSKKIKLEGSGHASFINGTLTVAPAASLSSIKDLRWGDNIVIQAGSNSSFIRDCWLVAGKTVTDLGAGNSVLIALE